MSDFSCQVTNNSPSWGPWDFLVWKVLPQRLGGDRWHLRKFKDAWVRHNKLLIKESAAQNKIPPELLAGICWVEVGGDPDFIDRAGFEFRSFDWSGPPLVDKYLTISKQPAKTSFGAVSIQLQRAASTLGINPAGMSTDQLRALAVCLEKDVFNIDIVARHLRELIDQDELQSNPPFLSMDQVRIVGARYNRGKELSLDEIKQNTSYGDFIVNFWPHLSALIR